MHQNASWSHGRREIRRVIARQPYCQRFVRQASQNMGLEDGPVCANTCRPRASHLLSETIDGLWLVHGHGILRDDQGMGCIGIKKFKYPMKMHEHLFVKFG